MRRRKASENLLGRRPASHKNSQDSKHPKLKLSIDRTLSSFLVNLLHKKLPLF